ncbi:hypothetical protein RRG08_024497 [Elysia crispata]|uniref:Uncharacterized protein n=1 Tax=Elysia crispata TaxID=231223 RepID=A0AAE1D312_9GAST|nr:hypothetical protein RRG08_024497 [Elysia crispata]
MIGDKSLQTFNLQNLTRAPGFPLAVLGPRPPHQLTRGLDPGALVFPSSNSTLEPWSFHQVTRSWSPGLSINDSTLEPWSFHQVTRPWSPGLSIKGLDPGALIFPSSDSTLEPWSFHQVTRPWSPDLSINDSTLEPWFLHQVTRPWSPGHQELATDCPVRLCSPLASRSSERVDTEWRVVGDQLGEVLNCWRPEETGVEGAAYTRNLLKNGQGIIWGSAGPIESILEDFLVRKN